MTATLAPPRPGLRQARGLIHFRMRSYVHRDGSRKPGQVVNRYRDECRPPIWGAEAWKPAGGKWSEDFGGRWLEKGDGKMVWQWDEEQQP